MLNGADGRDEDVAEQTPRVLEAVSAALELLVARNDKLTILAEPEQMKKALHAFQAARPPSISIAKYLERIYKYTSCSPSCFVVAFAYVDRLLHRHPSSLVVSLNVHRLILASVMVASKVLDDVHYDNAFYARVGGVSNSELNRLELELLFLLDFSVTVSSRVFGSYCLHIEKEMVGRGAAQKIDIPIAPNPEENGDTEVVVVPRSSFSTFL